MEVVGCLFSGVATRHIRTHTHTHRLWNSDFEATSLHDYLLPVSRPVTTSHRCLDPSDTGRALCCKMLCVEATTNQKTSRFYRFRGENLCFCALLRQQDSFTPPPSSCCLPNGPTGSVSSSKTKLWKRTFPPHLELSPRQTIRKHYNTVATCSSTNCRIKVRKERSTSWRMNLRLFSSCSLEKCWSKALGFTVMCPPPSQICVVVAWCAAVFLKLMWQAKV